MSTLLTLLVLAQVSTPPTDSPVAPEADNAATSAESLRKTIRDLRMNLLLGGDRVRTAEREAIDFYRDKSAFVDTRLDSVDSELIERRATYDVTLDRALGAEDAAERSRAFRDAQPLRTEITALEREAEELAEKRGRLAGLVDSIAARDRERQSLVAQLETSGSFPDRFGMPSLGIGLAPPALPVEASSPLEDLDLLEDLFARDPEAARHLVYDLDPVGYWDVFPLEPPAAALRRALTFPPADLPGRR